MRYRTKDGLHEYLGNLLFFLFLIAVGGCAGGLAVTFQSDFAGIKSAFMLLDSTEMAFGEIFLSTLFSHLGTFLVFCIAGYFWFLYPVLLSVLFMKGYFLGFTLRMLYQIRGMLSIPAALLGILLPHSIILACFLAYGVLSRKLRRPSSALEQQAFFGQFILIVLLFMAGVFLQSAIQPAIFKILM